MEPRGCKCGVIVWGLWGVSGPSGLRTVKDRSALLIRYCLFDGSRAVTWLFLQVERE